MDLRHLALAAAAALAATPLARAADPAPAKDPGAEFAEKAAKEQGAVKTASGLVYRPIAEGKGEQPKATSTVKVTYKGTFPDGKVFDESKAPITFPLNGVIPCWTEGLQRMKVGGKARLVCPPSIAYGARGAGGVIPPNATLAFEVELLGVQ
jgi:FKBP-type peptidyl-prolyl cis-trans isomerase FkpA